MSPRVPQVSCTKSAKRDIIQPRQNAATPATPLPGPVIPDPPAAPALAPPITPAASAPAPALSVTPAASAPALPATPPSAPIPAVPLQTAQSQISNSTDGEQPKATAQQSVSTPSLPPLTSLGSPLSALPLPVSLSSLNTFLHSSNSSTNATSTSTTTEIISPKVPPSAANTPKAIVLELPLIVHHRRSAFEDGSSFDTRVPASSKRYGDGAYRSSASPALRR